MFKQILPSSTTRNVPVWRTVRIIHVCILNIGDERLKYIIIHGKRRLTKKIKLIHYLLNCILVVISPSELHSMPSFNFFSFAFHPPSFYDNDDYKLLVGPEFSDLSQN